jgi:hypothetical protein
VLPKFELVVLDQQGAYRGHAVELNQQERSEVVGVVLKALQRHIQEQMDEVRALQPTVGGLPKDLVLGRVTMDSSVPRRRGRPRKVKP